MRLLLPLHKTKVRSLKKAYRKVFMPASSCQNSFEDRLAELVSRVGHFFSVTCMFPHVLIYDSILTGTGNWAIRISLCILYGGIYSHIIWPRTPRNMQSQKLEHLIICKLSCSICQILHWLSCEMRLLGIYDALRANYIYRTH